jgi:hypothetical protein
MRGTQCRSVCRGAAYFWSVSGCRRGRRPFRRPAVRPCSRTGRVRTAPQGFSVETPHNVEIPHCVETFRLHSMFYFRATKSFHVNRRPGAYSRAQPRRYQSHRSRQHHAPPGFHRTAPTAPPRYAVAGRLHDNRRAGRERGAFNCRGAGTPRFLNRAALRELNGIARGTCGISTGYGVSKITATPAGATAHQSARLPRAPALTRASGRKETVTVRYVHNSRLTGAPPA